jgi:hypothetical protein
VKVCWDLANRMEEKQPHTSKLNGQTLRPGWRRRQHDAPTRDDGDGDARERPRCLVGEGNWGEGLRRRRRLA